jgi:hypothetical protein
LLGEGIIERLAQNVRERPGSLGLVHGHALCHIVGP